MGSMHGMVLSREHTSNIFVVALPTRSHWRKLLLWPPEKEAIGKPKVNECKQDLASGRNLKACLGLLEFSHSAHWQQRLSFNVQGSREIIEFGTSAGSSVRGQNGIIVTFSILYLSWDTACDMWRELTCRIGSYWYPYALLTTDCEALKCRTRKVLCSPSKSSRGALLDSPPSKHVAKLESWEI